MSECLKAKLIAISHHDQGDLSWVRRYLGRVRLPRHDRLLMMRTLSYNGTSGMALFVDPRTGVGIESRPRLLSFGRGARADSMIVFGILNKTGRGRSFAYGRSR